MTNSTTTAPNKSRRYTVNVRLLLISLAVIALAIPVCYLWYHVQDRRAARAMLERAKQLESESDWGKAATYYQRYLVLEPDDTEVLAKLAEAYSQGEMTPDRTYRLVQLLYRVVGRAPERHDLRILLADNLLKMGDFDEAVKEAQPLLDKGPDEERARRRITALARTAQAIGNGPSAVAEAMPELIAAAHESPGNWQLIETAAYALRDFPTAAPEGEEDPASRADQLMDGLIAASPENIDARLARYRYRIRHRLPGANDDLQAILAIDPNQVEALLLSAVALDPATATDEQRQNAIDHLRQAIEREPKDFRLYLALARQLEQKGSTEEVIAVLIQGRQAADQKFELETALAATYLAHNDIELAEQTLSDLETRKSSSFVRLDAAQRHTAENLLLILNARLQLAKGNARNAIGKLEQVLAATETVGDHQSPQRLEAVMRLAQWYSSQGQWDRASEFWQMIVRERPNDPEIVNAASEALIRTGRVQDAAALIDRLASSTALSPDLLIKRAQMLMASQQQRPPANRNWSEFEQTMRQAKEQAPDYWQFAILEAQFNIANNNPDAAAAILRSGESQFADQAEFWRQSARIYQLLGRAEDWQRAVQGHRNASTSPLEQATLEVALLANEGKFDEADAILTRLTPSLNGDDRAKAQKMRIHLLRAADRPEDALAALKSLIKSDTDDTELLMMAIDLAVMQSDQKSAAAWEGQLRKATNDGPESRYFAARSVLQNWDQLSVSVKSDLEHQIAEIRAERPRWAPIVVLAARNAELRGDLRQALSDYQAAIDLGDRRPATYEQVVLILYKMQRFDEAQQYIARLTTNQASNPLLDTLAIEIATRQDRPEMALQLAKEAVDRFPNDPMRYLYWSDLLVRNSKNAEALDVLRGASRRFPSDASIWFNLLATMIRNGQMDEARSTLDGLLSEKTLADEQRHALAARVYQLLGDRELARQQYQLAIEKLPLDAMLRLEFARLLASEDPREARSQLQQARELDPDNADIRRELAVLLAASGEPADWEEAQQLLAANTSHSGIQDATDDRLRALLLSRQGRTRAERLANSKAAREILERLLELDSSEANIMNRLLIAQLLEQEANWSGDRSLLVAANEQFRTAVDSGPTNTSHLAQYIEFLLRIAADNSEHANEASSADSDPDRHDAMAAQRDQFLKLAESRLEELKRVPAGTMRGLDALVTALSARLLQLQGNDSDARAQIADFAERAIGEEASGNADAQRLLTNGQLFTSIGAHAEAEKWYRQLAEISPSAYTLVVQSMFEQGKKKEAVDYCLKLSGGKLTPEMASLLATVVTFSDGSAEDIAEARSAIETAAKQHKDNVALLQSQAVMRASRGEYDEAIAIFRRIVQLDPDNSLALNNLATLLAELPNQRTEALKVIAQAITISGRQPGLLDTQGTIYLKLGEIDQAIACLEEATARGTADARYYLHLAAAYQQANRPDDAQRMLAEAQAFGLDQFVLTGDDRHYLSSLAEQGK